MQALRNRLRSKEIWVVDADRYRNPDDDLPQDFDANREDYTGTLVRPLMPPPSFHNCVMI